MPGGGPYPFDIDCGRLGVVVTPFGFLPGKAHVRRYLLHRVHDVPTRTLPLYSFSTSGWSCLYFMHLKPRLRHASHGSTSSPRSVSSIRPTCEYISLCRCDSSSHCSGVLLYHCPGSCGRRSSACTCEEKTVSTILPIVQQRRDVLRLAYTLHLVYKLSN